MSTLDVNDNIIVAVVGSARAYEKAVRTTVVFPFNKKQLTRTPFVKRDDHKESPGSAVGSRLAEQKKISKNKGKEMHTICSRGIE